jgi:CHAT domain-containing protein
MLPSDHPDRIEIGQLEGDLAFLTGNVQRADEVWTKTLTLAEHRLGATHPAIPPLIRRLAIVAQQVGDLQRKDALLERARASAPPVSCYAESTAILNDTGTLSSYRGDFQRARNAYEEALARSRRCLGATHSMTTTILHNRAALAMDMGDFAEADRLYRQVVRDWSRRLGPEHPYVARGLDALAEVALARGRTSEAKQLLDRALGIRTRALGPNNPAVASTRLTLAQTVATRDPAAALRQLDLAIGIYRRTDQTQSPNASLAAALLTQGTVLQKRGDFALARGAFDEALAARERVFGDDHPLTAAVRSELASSEFGLGDITSAVRAALDSELVGRNHLRFTIRYLPERQALAYADKRPRGLDLALSAIADGYTVENEQILDSLVRSRAAVLDELGARVHLTAQSADPAIATLNAAATTARERFANLMMRSLTGSEPVSRTALDDARTAKEDAERALAERSAAARTELEQANLGLAEIRAGLPRGSVLVSFARYNRTTVTRSGTRAAPPRVAAAYMALVTRAGSAQIDAVPLGAASTIESAVTAWRTQLDGSRVLTGSLVDAERAYRLAGTTVRRRIWDPIAPFIRDASQVFVVPDGAINLVSLAALPTTTNRYLIDDGPVLHYLSTERDIVVTASAGENHGLLAVGGPAFGARPQTTPASSAVRGGCPTPGGLQFEDLPGSRVEATEIAKIWSSANGSGDATVLSGRAATTKAVTQDAARRRVVHLATHGFFLQSGCGAAVAGTRGIGGIAPRATSSPKTTENPLLLAGLAFAGANVRNTRVSGSDDGILTAEEVAGLNLQGTEWVVLSACDTGIGEVKAGEGVFGLRRAFHVAGARTIIMSLWSVEDRSTQVWMRYLYDARFNRRLSTSAAMQDASRRVLAERRARRASTHPFFWAGFVAAGSWQ